MHDVALTDLTDFLERHDRKSRRVFVAMLCTSLVVAAATFGYGLGKTGAPGAVLADLWLSILVYPLFIASFWTATATWGRKQPRPPGGRYLMNPDDARNVARVARAGYVFVACLGVVLIASQAGFALKHFGVMQSMKEGDWMSRAIAVASGLLTAYFGNAWSRMPTPRAPEQKPATQLKFKRVMCWLMVIHGLLLAVAALLPPSPLMIAGILTVCVSLMLSMLASIVVFRGALNSPGAT